MIVTIDGPAGSGKSTVAQRLASRLGIAYLDTGAMYRAVTLRALRQKVDLKDPAALERCAREADLHFSYEGGQLKVMLDGTDVSREIRSAEVTNSSHYAASAANVRAVLVEMQRTIGGQLGSFVTEGRDQGSVVFPQAELKVYLDASVEVRAKRRFLEMQQAGENVSYQQIHDDIAARDARDRGRSVGPLTRPDGAVVVDTSNMTIEQMVETLARYVEQRQ